VTLKAGKGEKFIEMDEQPFKANLDKIPTLKPAFRKDGTVTAGQRLVDLRRRRGAGHDARAPPPTGSAWRRWPASSATARTPRSRAGSPPPRWAR
jgi:hypothetical protein